MSEQCQWQRCRDEPPYPAAPGAFVVIRHPAEDGPLGYSEPVRYTVHQWLGRHQWEASEHYGFLTWLDMPYVDKQQALAVATALSEGKTVEQAIAAMLTVDDASPPGMR